MDDDLGTQQARGYDSYNVSLGDVMRGERATMGKSLLDVQRDLRIRAGYIAAIENCDASVFQTPGFIAGYVRSYARYLNMNPDDAFVYFCEESGFEGVHSDLTRPSLATKSATLLQSPVRPVNTDPIFSPRVPNTPRAAGFFSHFSVQGIGSVMVLGALVLGLGYGGWAVLQEVQRVQFAPIDQTPGVSSEVARMPGVADALDSSLPLIRPNSVSLEQLYRPQELEIPQLVPRDGPIATIDPDTGSTFAAIAPEAPPRPDPVAEIQPKVVESGPPPVDLVASKPAWVRIYFKDGSILFEKILDAGERYRLPADVQAPLLRAGNSGSVYVMVGDNTYGPIGKATGVARNVSLVPQDVQETFAQVFDLFDGPLAPPLNVAADTTAAASE
jgi:cytoskeleton protein RodZ